MTYLDEFIKVNAALNEQEAIFSKWYDIDISLKVRDETRYSPARYEAIGHSQVAKEEATRLRRRLGEIALVIAYEAKAKFEDGQGEK